MAVEKCDVKWMKPSRAARPHRVNLNGTNGGRVNFQCVFYRYLESLRQSLLLSRPSVDTFNERLCNAICFSPAFYVLNGAVTL